MIARVMASMAALVAIAAGPNLSAADKPQEAQEGTGIFGAFAASKEWTPPQDPAVLKKLAEWQDQKLGLLISWQACVQWGIDSWPLCPERFSWNERRDWTTGMLSPVANDNRAYKRSYENLLTTFNPIRFNPDRWAVVAKDAGVRYVLVMSKHCDGFNMYDTKFSDYKITSPRCPFSGHSQADVLKAQVNAFHRQGLIVGIYASKCDWAHPDYWSPDTPLTGRGINYNTRKHCERWARYKRFFWNQVEELVSGYGPLDILWLDDGWVRAPLEDLDITGVAAMARKHDPGLIVVDRTVSGPNENYITPEQVIPATFLPYPWETCMTMGGHWNWYPKDDFKTAGTLIRDLCRIVARNGNYVIGIGPDANGEFDPVVYARLREIGAWLKLNGEAIYETRPVKPYESGDCVFTRRRDGTVYVIVLSKDDSGTLPERVAIPAELAAGVRRFTLLGWGPLQPGKTKDGVTTIAIPTTARSKPPCPCAWTIKLTPGKPQ